MARRRGGGAVAAGVVAESVALVGFGADSLIEAAAGLVVLWLVHADRLSSHRAERRAQQLIAASFLLLAAYVLIESARDLIAGHHPQASWLGVGLAAVTLVGMPPGGLRKATRRPGAGFLGNREREPADDAVRVSVSGVVDRSARERGRGVVVG